MTSGKTTLLTSIANTVNPSNGLYICYNKSIATEAKSKFPSSIHCCTTHSLAFRPIVIDNKLKLGTFNAYSIKEKLDKDLKYEFVRAFRSYCLSSYLSFEDYVEEEDLPSIFAPLGQKYYDLMTNKKIDCTHDYYLKQFHLQLASGHIEYDPFDIIMLDEAGDLNQVTLAIFNLLPSSKKVMVGDPHQNIYGFNDTINGFKLMEDHGTTLPMSQSFRVADHLAEKIQSFCQKYLDPSMQFRGVPIHSTTITTSAYIARTNASLISKMMELNELSTPYGLTRKADQIFALPLALCNLRPNGFIPVPEYKHLQDDVDEYYANQHQYYSEFKTLYSYLLSQHEDDVVLTNTIKLVLKHGKPSLIKCHSEAKKHENSHQPYMLGTCHSMKGLEADSVTISECLNESVIDAMLFKQTYPNLPAPDALLAELNLYYVAVSRARITLNNAKWLNTTPKPKTDLLDYDPHALQEVP